MYKIDLNCDMGEGFGAYTLGQDAQLMRHITSANIACGFHAGDSMVMAKTVELCAKNGVSIGAHPGFPDLQGFGRRNMSLTPDEAAACVLYQVGALGAFCRVRGVKLGHVKLHGALYNMAAKDFDLSLAICKAIESLDQKLIIMAPFGSQTIKAAQHLGLPNACEVFADRAYMADGSLVPRSMKNAMITDEKIASQRVLNMILNGKLTDIGGNELKIVADTVCVHGDNIHALEFACNLRAEFEQYEIEVASLR